MEKSQQGEWSHTNYLSFVNDYFPIYQETIWSVLCSRETYPSMALMRKYDVQTTGRGTM